MLKLFRSDNLHGANDNTGKEKEVWVHEIFYPDVVKMDAAAKRYGIIVFVNQAVRYEGVKVNGAIVAPASFSDHLVGCALDVNLLYKKRLYTSKDLMNPSGEIRQFIDEWKALGNRWGGDFKTPDDVHFDNGLYHKNPVLWKTIHDEVQKVTTTHI